MEEFIAIVAGIFGILSIILFFRVWGMTNDVDKIMKYICDGDKWKNIDVQQDIVRLNLKGQNAKAVEELTAFLDKRLDLILADSSSRGIASEKQDKWNEVVESYEGLYKYLGAKMPDHLKNFNFEKFFETLAGIE